MQEVITEIINNNTTIIPDLSQPFSGETLYETCDLYIGFKSNLLPTVEIEYSDGIQRVTLERLTRMEDKTYAIHFLFDRDYFINRDYEIEPFSVSGTIRTTDLDIKRDFYLNISQYGSHLEYTGENYIMFTSAQDGSTIGLVSRSTNQTTLEYFTEQSTGWRDLTPAETITVNSGECVYVRGILTGNNTKADYTNFRLVGDISVSGNCNAVWSYNDLNADLYQYCGYKLFNNCSGLTDASLLELPSDVLADYCYNNMFHYCLNLQSAPVIRATIFANECCSSMFNECRSLNSVPDLSATTMGSGSCQYMFYHCISLEKAPNLPATKLGRACYRWMFQDCNSLSSVQDALPALNLEEYCYCCMFSGCTSLEIAPILPAETMRYECYKEMFGGCSSLTVAPELYAKVLDGQSYCFMFRDCSSLKYIKCLATDTSASSALNSWVSGVSSSGIFVKSPEATSWPTGNNGIPDGWTVVDCPKTLCITNVDKDKSAVISLVQTSGESNPDVKYSRDNGLSWLQWTYDSETITLNPGECVYFKGNNPDGFNSHPSSGFIVRRFLVKGGNVSLSGNIMGLLDDGACTATTLPNASCFMRLFGVVIEPSSEDEISSVRYAHELKLPVANVTSYCYSGMFRYCERLITAPKLPCTDLSNASGCYNWMFADCINLEIPPELPATVLASDCYGQMFFNCKKLQIAPNLPAMNVPYHACYAMLQGCVSLTKVPELPATTVGRQAYFQMFAWCSGLTKAHEILPATTLGEQCYAGMYSRCGNLETTPILPAETLVNKCYWYMFGECPKISSITCLAKNNVTTNNCSIWVDYGITRNGTFIKSRGVTWPNGTSGIPSGWTVYDFDNYIVS